MKLERKFFSFKLFLEGIRQLKLLGIIAAIIYGLQVLILTISYPIYKMQNELYDPKKVIPEVVNGLNIMPILFASFILVAPVMTIYLFSFLNKRSRSDFYHSIPHTRICIYFSFLAAIFAWLTILTIGTALIGITTMLIFSKFYSLMWGAYFLFALGTLVASFAVAAGVTIAMAVSGTVFTNIFVSGFILFLPRLIITIIPISVSQITPIIVPGQVSPFLSYNINIITGVIFYIFGGSYYGMSPSIDFPLTNPASIIYTAILCIVYSALACILFNRRKSESAAKSAPNRYFQALYRITFTMVYFSIVIALILEDLLTDFDDVFLGLIICIIIGITIYLLYELISTRSFKKMFRSIPSLSIVAACCLVLVGTIFGIRRIQLSFNPKADEIESITLIKTRDRYYDESFLLFHDYLNLYTSEVEVTDPKLISLVSASLNENATLLKDSNLNEFYDKYHLYYFNSYNYGTDRQGYIYDNFKINTKSGSKYRTVFYPAANEDIITNAIENDKATKDVYMNLPDAIKNTVQIWPVNGSGDNLSKEQSETLLSIARNELSNADFTQWHDTLYNGDNSLIFNIRYTIKTGPAVGKTLEVPIYETIFPETVKKYYDYLDDNLPENIKKITDILSDENSSSIRYFDNFAVLFTKKGHNFYEKENLFDGNTYYLPKESIEYLLSCRDEQCKLNEAKENQIIATINVYPDFSEQAISLSYPIKTDITAEEIQKNISE